MKGSKRRQVRKRKTARLINRQTSTHTDAQVCGQTLWKGLLFLSHHKYKHPGEKWGERVLGSRSNFRYFISSLTVKRWFNCQCHHHYAKCQSTSRTNGTSKKVSGLVCNSLLLDGGFPHWLGRDWWHKEDCSFSGETVQDWREQVVLSNVSKRWMVQWVHEVVSGLRSRRWSSRKIVRQGASAAAATKCFLPNSICCRHCGAYIARFGAAGTEVAQKSLSCRSPEYEREREARLCSTFFERFKVGVYIEMKPRPTLQNQRVIRLITETALLFATL